MKYLINLLFLFPFVGFSQVTTFDKLYTNGHIACAVIPNSQGYVVAGNSNNQDYWLFQTNLQGNILWEKTYGLHYGIVDASFLRSAVKAKDNGYFLAGYSYSMLDSNWQKPYGYIVKTDSSGNKQWDIALHTTYDSTMMNYIYSVTTTKDGGCLITGEIYLSYQDTCPVVDTTQYGIYIVKLSESGLVEWEKRYPYGLGTPIYREVVELGGQQGYMMAYCTRYAKKCAIFRIDINGDTLWQKIFVPSNYDSTQYYSFGNITQTPDNNYLASGGVLVKIDINGNVLWQNDAGKGKVVAVDNSLYACSGSNLYKLDENNGNEVWSKDMGVPIKDFSKTADGGFIILTVQGLSAVRLLKTDCEGNIINPINCITVINAGAELLYLFLYPNPSDNKFMLEVGEIGNYEVQILDVQGKMQQSQVFSNNNEYEFGTENLAEGIYILQVKNMQTNQVSQLKLIKKSMEH